MKERSMPRATGIDQASTSVDAELARLSGRAAPERAAARGRAVLRVDLVSGVAAAVILPAAWTMIGWAWAGMTGLIVGCVAGVCAALVLLVAVLRGAA